MKRRNGSGRFRPSAGGDEDINPMDGVANLADVMLVLACGIMLALITYWNVDVGASAAVPDSVQQGQEITEDVSGLGGDAGDELEGDGLEEYGTVYKDPVTGKLYMIAGGD